jgi:hypothetical protein
MAQTIPHALSPTEIYNSIGAARRPTFVAWPLFSLYMQFVASGNRDAVRMMTGLANNSLAPDAVTKILNNPDSAQILTLLDQLDSPAQAVPAGNWAAVTASAVEDSGNLAITVNFTKGTTVISKIYKTGVANYSADLAQWAKNIILQLDQIDAAQSAFVPGPITLP